jgi:hypothetical protein
MASSWTLGLPGVMSPSKKQQSWGAPAPASSAWDLTPSPIRRPGPRARVSLHPQSHIPHPAPGQLKRKSGCPIQPMKIAYCTGAGIPASLLPDAGEVWGSGAARLRSSLPPSTFLLLSPRAAFPRAPPGWLLLSARRSPRLPSPGAAATRVPRVRRPLPHLADPLRPRTRTCDGPGRRLRGSRAPRQAVHAQRLRVNSPGRAPLARRPPRPLLRSPPPLPARRVWALPFFLSRARAHTALRSADVNAGSPGTRKGRPGKAPGAGLAKVTAPPLLGRRRLPLRAQPRLAGVAARPARLYTGSAGRCQPGRHWHHRALPRAARADAASCRPRRLLAALGPGALPHLHPAPPGASRKGRGPDADPPQQSHPRARHRWAIPRRHTPGVQKACYSQATNFHPADCVTPPFPKPLP